MRTHITELQGYGKFDRDERRKQLEASDTEFFSDKAAPPKKKPKKSKD